MSYINHLFFKVANERDSELDACEYLDAFAKKCDFLPESIDEMRLAFIEALINAKEHAPKEAPPGSSRDVSVLLTSDDDNLKIQVRDFGQGFDPGMVEKPDIKKKLKSANKRGWGIMLMEKLMDGVEISSFPPSGTLITMVKKKAKIDPPQAVDTVREHKRIERLKYILGSFIDLSSFLCQNKNLETGLRSMLRILLGTLGVSRGAVYIFDADRDQCNCMVDIKLKIKDRFPVLKITPDMLKEFFRQETLEVSAVIRKHVPEFFRTFTTEEIDVIYLLRTDTDTLGLLVLGARFRTEESEIADPDLLSTISRNISSAINTFKLMEQLKTANSQLDQRINELNAVREASQIISSELEMENLPFTIERIFKSVINVSKFSLAINDRNENRFAICQTGRDLPSVLDLWSSPVSRFVVQKLESLFVSDISRDKRFQFVRSQNYNTNSFIVVPIMVQDELLGVISMTDKCDNSELTERDYELAQLLSVQVAIALKNANLYKLGITDAITHLYSHHYFKMRIAQEICRQRRIKSHLSAILFEVDDFAQVPEKYSSHLENHILVKVANIVKRQVRFNDIACRYSGAKFAVILPDTQLQGAAIVAEKLRTNIEGIVAHHQNSAVKVTASFGVVSYDVASSLEGFLDKLEAEMCKARNQGGNCISVVKTDSET